MKMQNGCEWVLQYTLTSRQFLYCRGVSVVLFSERIPKKMPRHGLLNTKRMCKAR